MKHLKSNYASNPQGPLPLFDSVKPNKTMSKWIIKGEEWDITQDKSVPFDGVTYEPKFDATRLRGEMAFVYNRMKDGNWRTIQEIMDGITFSETGISARLRDLRKSKWGSHTVNRRRRGDPKRGIFEYQLL